ncbi:FAD-dependent oxidoreductase [Rhodococcus sp. IEGM 1379]|uniref:FAD-dependent oxidoreductase n=1 Tax=Rhodococcus sp. IEGM 1379 TaxID=3047086 RepID=UPI0024B640E0|nr:FAD-dependent oxidoreductase [Rhodococcus sp. IEGM 1379]MDI9916143.1 FAD-dependent oxidoreductase [Rhodococcus sp. IEGM 1379]
MSEIIDVIVIGGGLVGSSAAWRLAKRGRSVVQLEQYGPSHKHGASHGTSRIYRQAYDNHLYTGLAAEALPLWRELEIATDIGFLELTGAVDHGLPEAVLSKARILVKAGIKGEILTPAEASARWPGLRFDTTVLHHPDAGRLHADRAITAMKAGAAFAGAEVRHDTRVLSVVEASYGVDVITDRETLRTRHVVIAAGAWTVELIDRSGFRSAIDLPTLVTTQEQPAHFAPLDPEVQWPSFVHHAGAELKTAGIYGLGSVDGIKIGEHATGPVVTPETRDYIADAAGQHRLVVYAESWLPGVDSAQVESMTCLYTSTPDSNFVIDRVGAVTVAAGFSGHGFKFGPALGELVSDLVDGNVLPPDQFRLGERRK